MHTYVEDYTFVELPLIFKSTLSFQESPLWPSIVCGLIGYFNPLGCIVSSIHICGIAKFKS